MLVNSCNWLVTVTLFALCVLSLNTCVVAYNAEDFSSYMGETQPDEGKKQINLLNKEILFGDASSGDVAISKTKASVNPTRNGLPEVDMGNGLGPNPADAVQMPLDDSSDEVEHELLKRSQRTDQLLGLSKPHDDIKATIDSYRANHNSNSERLDFDMENELLKSLLANAAGLNGYEDESDEEDLEPYFEDDMDAEQMNQPNRKDNFMADFKAFMSQKSRDQAQAKEPLPVHQDKIIPVDLKESNYKEEEYNRNLKLTDSNKGQDDFESDPFMNNEFLNDLGLTAEQLNTIKDQEALNENRGKSMVDASYKQAASAVIDEDPSMAIKSSQYHNPHMHDKIDRIKAQNDYLIIFLIAGCTLAGVMAMVAAGVCWATVYKHRQAAANVEYGETKDGIFNSTNNASVKSKSSTSSGDRRLAQSAQMYHYQHQKQQMIAMEKANSETKQNDNSDASDGETEEGDYTVYECPGLAPTGEMEVKNPLFKEDFQSNNNIAEHASDNTGSSQTLSASSSVSGASTLRSDSMSNTTLPPSYTTVVSEDETNANKLVKSDVAREAKPEWASSGVDKEKKRDTGIKSAKWSLSSNKTLTDIFETP